MEEGGEEKSKRARAEWKNREGLGGMRKEMERGDGGMESQRAAWREDVGETKRRLRKKKKTDAESGREGNKREVEGKRERRKLNERVKEL